MRGLRSLGPKADIAVHYSDLEVLLLLSWPSSLPIGPQVLAYALSSNTWWAVVFLSAVSVITMLGMMAKILRYELMLIQVVSSARKMRISLEQSIDEAELANELQSTTADQTLSDAEESSTEDQSAHAEQLMDEEYQAQAADESDNAIETDSAIAPESATAAAA